MTYSDELQQYEDRITRKNRVINRLLVLCFILIVLVILAVIMAIGWCVNSKYDPPRKAGYTKIEFGRGVTSTGDTVEVFEYAGKRLYNRNQQNHE